MTTNLIEQARTYASDVQAANISDELADKISRTLLELAAALEQRAEGVGELPDEQFNVLAYEHADSCYRRGENTLSYEFTPEQLRAFCRAALAQQARPQWRTIDSAPQTGRVLLLGYRNSHGKWRTVRGQWLSQEYIDEYWEDPEGVEAGWFETPVEADEPPNCWPIDPTHWMPLPEAPNE